jgi:hypothetical protein
VGERKRNKLWEREKLWEGERRKLIFFLKEKLIGQTQTV